MHVKLTEDFAITQGRDDYEARSAYKLALHFHVRDVMCPRTLIVLDSLRLVFIAMGIMSALSRTDGLG
jgi:hypothetical protein